MKHTYHEATVRNNFWYYMHESTFSKKYLKLLLKTIEKAQHTLNL